MRAGDGEAGWWWWLVDWSVDHDGLCGWLVGCLFGVVVGWKVGRVGVGWLLAALDQLFGSLAATLAA